MTHLVIGTAGHIDHGKSTLVLALTGTDPDRLKEEKARGITIDLGFAHWEAPGLSVGFVDVPGHERFVKNMLAGVGGIDAVMLVIAADESVMPQTREHFDICRLLQVPSGVVVLTKADLVDAETIELVRLEARELTKGSFLADAPIIPVSARTGAGLDQLGEAIVALGGKVGRRSLTGPVRLPVDRVFSMKGFGTVVTGTLVSGQVAADQDLSVLPGGRAVKVRALQVHGARQNAAVAGQRVAVNLGGVDVADLVRGQSLVQPGAFAEARTIDARLEVIGSARPVRHGARVRFHQGTSEVLGRVAVSSLVSDAGADEEGIASEVPPGRSAYVRIRLESPVVVTRRDRFVLRAYSPPATIAGGVVIDPHPPRGGIRTVAGRRRFRLLDPMHSTGGGPDDGAVMALVVEGAGAGMPLMSLGPRLGLERAAQPDLVARLERTGEVRQVGGVLVSAPLLRRMADEVAAALGEHHRVQPLSDGLNREEMRERLFARAAPGVFEQVLDDLTRAGTIVAKDRIALATHRVAAAGPEAEARDRIDAHYREAGLKPPDAQEAATALGLPMPLVESMIALLIRQRRLVKLDTLVFHQAALARLVGEVRELKTSAAGGVARLDVAAFKERYSMTRKFAIPLLEYLDRERVTRRVGDSRVVI